MRILRSVLLLTVAVLMTSSISACGRIFFYPSPKLYLEPSEILLEFEDVYFESEDGVRLHGWFLPAVAEPLGTVVFLHGNAENISNHLSSVYWLPKEGFNVFLFDYRGFGRSEGSPEIAGSVQDSEAALEEVFARRDVDPEKVAILGQSLGGAFAIQLGAHSPLREQIRAVVVDSGFSSFRRIAKEKLAHYWITFPFQWPVSWLIPSSFDPIDAVAAVSPIPLLIIHGERDEVVPVHHGKELYAVAEEPKRIWIVPDGEHIGALRTASYRRMLADYLRSQFATVLANQTTSSEYPAENL